MSGKGFLIARWDAGWFRWLDDEIAELPFQEDEAASAIRRALSADPVAFAVLYFSHHLKDSKGDITWSQAHFSWAREAESWATPEEMPREHRTAIIAPRECGKSTWWFLILPLWAAVNGHSQFAVAFAHATAQAESHLATLKGELDHNALLRNDWPLLVEPARRRTGTTVADRAGMLHMKSGFIFAARGIDSAVLGLKVGDRRPDVIVLDDIEPDEANYSPELAIKRLGTVTDSIFPLNIRARVVFVGTVTMPGSLMHDLVKAAMGVETADWVRDENVHPHHFRAIQVSDDGTEFSLWPSKWPIEFLQAIRHTRSYAKNYDNDPMARDGVYWVREDFHYGEPEGRKCTRTIISLDPAVTTKKTSDFSGVSVVGFMPELRKRAVGRGPSVLVAPSACVIRHSSPVKLSGQHLKKYVIELMAKYPQIRAIVIETNQGGDLWKDIFTGIPNLKVITVHSTEPKEVRFATALEFWQRNRVFHVERLPQLEEQAVGFPRHKYDDVIDSAVTGVSYFLGQAKTIKAKTEASSYV